jgi:hypothetical protein
VSALSTSYGLWYRCDISSGRFLPLSAPPGHADNICCVTGASDPENQVTQVLNAAALVPAGTTRWTVAYSALKQAYQGGTRGALNPA